MSDKDINIKPINSGNAEVINEICSPIIRLTLLRYEAIADFYTEEPHCILIKKKMGDKNIEYRQIFRYRRWIPNNCTYSWSVYLESREWEEDSSGLVLRYVNWDRSKDTERVKSTDKGLILNNWPEIRIHNLFFEPKDILELKELLIDFDKTLENGIRLNNRTAEEAENTFWLDIEIMRLFDWGQVHATWNLIRENKEIENKLVVLEKTMDNLINLNVEQVYQMSLDYSILPDVFKQQIKGSEE